MNRRALLGTVAPLGAAVMLRQPVRAAENAPAGTVFELRRYHLRRGPQGKLLSDFLSQVWMPAVVRLGVTPVGVFELVFGAETPVVLVLIPHASFEAAGTFDARLAADAIYTKACAQSPFASAAADKPAFMHIERELLQAPDFMPRVEVPAAAAKKAPRIFELRTYESPSEAAHIKKMSMFTPAIGELAIFRRVGLTPVFFGRSVFGPRQPSFTYMLAFDDLAAREKAWSVFRADPAWLKLSALPGYGDELLSNISDLIIKPTSVSQI